MRRILMLGDAGCHTGFARVVKEIADYLHQTGRWEVVVRAINYQDNHGITYDYDVQPITYDLSDPTGAATLRDHIAEVKPDVLWAVQDPWNLAGYAFELPVDLPSVCYVPVDTPAIKWDNALALGAWTEVVVYTQFGARELAASMQDAVDVLQEGLAGTLSPDQPVQSLSTLARDDRSSVKVTMERLARLQNPSQFHVVPHGMDLGAFTRQDKRAAREAIGLNPDAFTVGMVCTNHGRKRLDVAIRAFAKFAKHAPDAQLVFHCYGRDDSGYDIASLTRLYGVAEQSAAIHWQKAQLTEEELCTLYNCFDVHLNVSGGEGWGLTSFESAACGVAQIVPDCGATKELWGDHAWRAKIDGWHHATSFLNTAHADVSVTDVAQGLLCMYKVRDTLTEYQERAEARALLSASWKDVGESFEAILDLACWGDPPTPMSLNDLRAARTERIRTVILQDDEPLQSQE